MQAPRSVDAMVAELWALLHAADVPGPYVMVGHSMGGMVARLFAGTYPDEVVGFVSVDAAHESYYEAYKQLLSPDQYQSVYEAATAEIDIEATATRMREARIDQPLHPMPMVVSSTLATARSFPTRSVFPPTTRSRPSSSSGKRHRTTWPRSCPAPSTQCGC